MAQLDDKQFTVQNFINGNFEPPFSQKYIDNFNPSNGKILGKIPESNKEDVDAAVSSAKKAFKSWSKFSTKERSDFLNKIADLIEKNASELAQIESLDQGKPISLAQRVDIPRAIANFRFFAGAILHHEERASSVDDKDRTCINYTYRKPIGVCGLISPWNLPLYLLTWKLAPALAVGNTVVCKPSEFASLTAWKLCSIVKEAGIPDGVVNMIFGSGRFSGAFLVQHPDAPLISFTGGTATAEHIIRDSAPHYKKLYLELGGKNPNIIFDDANLDECVKTTVLSSFSNQGEICLCGSRILVQEGIYEEFIKRFVEATKQLVVGNPKDPKTQVGALVSNIHRDKVESYIALAQTEGGVVLCGGDRPKNLPSELANGYYLNPTIIANLSATCRTQQEEIFGPVVGITTFKTEEEAIEIANCTKYGLSASIWTENVRRANRVATQIDSGTVWVNCWMLRDLKMPFGGMKHSGLGRASGYDSIDFYTEQQTICLKY